MTGGIGVHLQAGRNVVVEPLQQQRADGDRLVVGDLDVVHVQVEVDLLGCASRPLRRA